MSIELAVIVVSAVLRISSVILTWIWRLITIALIRVIALFLALFTVRWGVVLVIAALIFGGGLLAQEFQEETMMAVDIVWECGIIRAAQGVASFLVFIFRMPYEFIATEWNDIVLFVFDAFAQLIEDIQMLVKIGNLSGIPEFLQSIRAELTFAEFWDTVSIIASAIEDFVVELAELFMCVWSAFGQFLTAITVTLTFMNQDCTYCALDPPVAYPADQQGICTLRQTLAPGLEPDCDLCHDFVKDWFVCAADFLDFITLGLTDGFGTSLPRVFRALACVVNSLLKPPFWILQGLIDDAVNSNGCVTFADLSPIPGSGSLIDQWFTSTECGKPAGCSFPPPETNTDIPIGVVPCFTELIRAVTADEIDELFELIFSFFFPFVTAVINSIVNIVGCYAEPAFETCLENYPFGPGTPGQCGYDLGDTGLEFVVPDEGIFECFEIVGTCLDDPVNIPLLAPLGSSGTDILSFLFGDFWRLTVDFAVCPFVGIVDCFVPSIPDCNANPGGGDFDPPLDFLNDPICALRCIETEVPPLSALAETIADALAFIGETFDDIFGLIQGLQDSIDGILKVFECLAKCEGDTISEIVECVTMVDPTDSAGGGGCEAKRDIRVVVPTQVDYDAWKTFLLDNGVTDESTCGNALHSSLPGQVNKTQWGDYAIYWSCLGMYGAALGLKDKCGDKVDVGGLMAMNTLGTCIEPVLQCYSASHNNSRREVPLRKPAVNTYNTVKNYREGVLNGSVQWSLTGDILRPMWQRFTDSNYYRLSSEFGQEWINKKHRYSEKINDGNVTSIVSYGAIRQEEQRDLEELYLAYVNSILFHHRTQRPLPRRRAHEVIRSEGSLPIVRYDAISSVTYYTGLDGREYPALTMRDLEHKRKVAIDLYDSMRQRTVFAQNHSQLFNDAWTLFNERYSIEYWPWVQKTHVIYYTVIHWKYVDFFKWLKGERKYLVSQGFVDEETYEHEMHLRDTANEGSALDIMSGNYSVRRHREYEPFPILKHPNVSLIPWAAKASPFLMDKHRDNQILRQRRKEKGFPKVIRGEVGLVFDANQVIYDITDALLQLFFGITGDPVNSAVDSIINFWSDVDLEEVITVDLVAFLNDYFTCAIPENIDGTELYSPWCVLLLPETLFDLFKLVPNEDFPLQIQWPDELILTNCTNIYNGDNNLFNFSLSDNCLENDGQERPFCQDCDYCEREYRSCRMASCLFDNGTRVNADTLCEAAGGTQLNGGCFLPSGEVLGVLELCEFLGGEFERGIGDVLDTILYIIAVIPRFFDEFFDGGISVFTLEDVYGVYIGIVAIGLLLSLFGFIVYVLVVGLTHIPVWTFCKVIGDKLPFGLILLVITVLILFLIPQLSVYFLIPFSILILLSLLWVASLLITFPGFAESANIIQALIDAVKILDKSVLLFWINFQPLLFRLDQFNYGTGPIPDIDTFCIAWTFANAGLLVLILFFGFFIGRLFIQWLIVTVIFIIDLIIAIIDIRLRYRVWRLWEDMELSEDQRMILHERQQGLLKKIGQRESVGGVIGASAQTSITGSSSNNNNNNTTTTEVVIDEQQMTMTNSVMRRQQIVSLDPTPSEEIQKQTQPPTLVLPKKKKKKTKEVSKND